MTRDCLRPLEGKPVLITGRLTEIRKTDEEVRYLLTTVRVFAWDGNAPIDPNGTPTARIDHLWCPVSLDKAAPGPPMLKRVILAGRVGWYARTNGTADLAVRIGRTINLDLAVRDFRQNYTKGASSTAVADSFADLLENIDQPDALPFSRHMAVSDAKETIARWIEDFRRSAAAEARAKATSLTRGHRPRAAKRFTDLLKTAA